MKEIMTHLTEADGSPNSLTLGRRSFLGLAATVSATLAMTAAATTPADAEGSIEFPSSSGGLPHSSGSLAADEITQLDAVSLSLAIRDRHVTCVEVMAAYLDRIDRLNPHVNAIVNLRPHEELLLEAAEKDALLEAGNYQGWMHGFPHAVKDAADAKGLKTTYGFFRPPFDTEPATEDSVSIARIRSAGAVIIGKTNIPEFGLGSHTYNSVFGTTRNPYDLTRTAGGSSGGAAAALAARLVPVADGSDFMGSLRNPAGWNNLFGLRPSFGAVPIAAANAFTSHGAVEGPMARTAKDLALLYDTMSGYDPRAPLSLLRPQGQSLADNLDRDFTDVRLAWMGDLGGYLPTEPGVIEMCETALANMDALGVSVESVSALPKSTGFNGSDDLWPLWLTFRHWHIGAEIADLYQVPEMAAALKTEARFEIDGLLHGPTGQGPISGLDIWNMSLKRTAMYRAFLELFDTFDYIALPTAQVFPFPVETHWPATVDGVSMSSYHRWMETTTIATLIGAPAISIPAGFNADGLPMGLQILARPLAGDLQLLQLAHAWEQQTPWGPKSAVPDPT